MADIKIVLVCVAFCLVAVLPGVTSKSKRLPKELKICKRGEDACLMGAIQDALPIFVTGLPKLGVPSVDPLHVEEVKIEQGTGAVQIKLSLKDQDILAISRATVTKVRSDMKDDSFLLEIGVSVPYVEVLGNYVIDGKVLVLPIRGQGKNNFTFSDFTATVTMKGHVISRNNENFGEIDGFDFDFDTSRLHLDLENLFNGDKTLGDNMVVFLNENWQILLEELKPAISQAVEGLLRRVVHLVFSQVPYDAIFPKA